MPDPEETIDVSRLSQRSTLSRGELVMLAAIVVVVAGVIFLILRRPDAQNQPRPIIRKIQVPRITLPTVNRQPQAAPAPHPWEVAPAEVEESEHIELVIDHEDPEHNHEADVEHEEEEVSE